MQEFSSFRLSLCMHACQHIHIHTCTHICTYACTHARACMHAHTIVTCINMHVYADVYNCPFIPQCDIVFFPPGYARLSNVEFFRSGQEGFVASYDARYSMTFFDIGRVSTTRPSYITKCTFHNGFSPAIAVIGTHSLELVNNVIHHTVGSGECIVLCLCVMQCESVV